MTPEEQQRQIDRHARWIKIVMGLAGLYLLTLGAATFFMRRQDHALRQAAGVVALHRH